MNRLELTIILLEYATDIKKAVEFNQSLGKSRDTAELEKLLQVAIDKAIAKIGATE